ncbi:hypothetical protein AGR6A_pAt20071 [Agrobacterium sp. NCPPB 925]|nr:hypothetical protein AGR6A_pAt20071 [Agrobacterium sp. NCPPB 925]
MNEPKGRRPPRGAVAANEGQSALPNSAEEMAAVLWEAEPGQLPLSLIGAETGHSRKYAYEVRGNLHGCCMAAPRFPKTPS